VIAAILALSGAFYAFWVWVIPPLWPGYVIWIGWIAVAAGFKRWQEKWFWIVSTTWNMILFLIFFFTRTPSDGGNRIQRWYTEGHLVLAILLSVFLMATVPWDTWSENRSA